MKKLIALILAMVILTVMMPTLSLGESTTTDTAEPLTPVESLVDASGNVIFNDSLVENEIRDNLGITDNPITKKQIAKLKYFGIFSDTPQTVDLSVLQLCQGLNYIRLDNVTPKNWNAISICKKLTDFVASRTKLSSLNFLLESKNLKEIDMFGSTCEDISAVTKMTKLYTFATDTQLKDITPLNTTNTKIIYLSGLTDKQVNDLIDARGKELVVLQLKDTSLSDTTLTRFETLNIKALYLDNVTCSSISPFFAMKSLKWSLKLSNMKVESLEGIQNLRKINGIKLDNVEGITDYSPVFQLTALTTLMISNCAAPNLQDIESLKKLTWLSLDNLKGTTDITPIFSLKKLDTLDLKNLQITSINCIKALTKLKTLDLSGTNSITDYSPLSQLKKLQSIIVDDPSLLPEGLPVN